MDSILICSTLVDLPTPSVPSVERWCSVCATPVWISAESLEFMERTPATKPMCMDCAIGFSQTHTEMAVQLVPGSRGSHSDTQIRAALKRARQLLGRKYNV